ncbi:hypothetical protein RBSH_03800 [Rhodopirellula baltica SH28]|uniref:Uncharacterized protein n=1 Tax=Rhodopirellula baltica SH28 TaxID=993517 RepID=K5DDH8_RHOBT|nr:hypothetical protein RBSH_03800 [Rhodopirellula baltica SH28]
MCVNSGSEWAATRANVVAVVRRPVRKFHRIKFNPRKPVLFCGYRNHRQRLQ